MSKLLYIVKITCSNMLKNHIHDISMKILCSKIWWKCDLIDGYFWKFLNIKNLYANI